MLTDWLMDSSIPSIRYFTLHHLLDKSEQDPQVQAVRKEMQTAGPIPTILAKQTDAGHWAGERGYYGPKYVSTHWSMLLLAELGIDPQDERFQHGVDYMLSQSVPKVTSHGLECLWGNVLFYVLHAGRFDDPGTQRIIDYLVTNDSWKCAYNNELPCAWGAIRTLFGLALIPEDRRSKAVQSAIDDGIDFLLSRYSLMEANYPTPGKPHKLWRTVNFPLFYQGDILLVLRTLAALNKLDHPKAQAALDWLQSKRKSNGQWAGSSPYRARTWAALGDSEETNRWVSLQAAMVLKAAGMVA